MTHTFEIFILLFDWQNSIKWKEQKFDSLDALLPYNPCIIKVNWHHWFDYLKDKKPKIDASLVEHNSHMKAAIPVLPVWLAWFCCVMNCIGPGTGGYFEYTNFHFFHVFWIKFRYRFEWNVLLVPRQTEIFPKRRTETQNRCLYHWSDYRVQSIFHGVILPSWLGMVNLVGRHHGQDCK